MRRKIPQRFPTKCVRKRPVNLWPHMAPPKRPRQGHGSARERGRDAAQDPAAFSDHIRPHMAATEADQGHGPGGGGGRRRKIQQRFATIYGHSSAQTYPAIHGHPAKPQICCDVHVKYKQLSHTCFHSDGMRCRIQAGSPTTYGRRIPSPPRGYGPFRPLWRP